MIKYNLNTLPQLTESQINKLDLSRRKHSFSRQHAQSSDLYQTLKLSIDTSSKYTIKQNAPLPLQKRILDAKSQKEFELIINNLSQPCTHLHDNCLHDQLFEQNSQGKCFRQLCEFRIDYNKKVRAIEVIFFKQLRQRRIEEIEFGNDDNFKIIILDAINKKQASVKRMSDMAKINTQFKECAKRLSQLCKCSYDSDQLLCQFEDIQNRKRYTKEPSFWSLFDCSCSINTI